MSIVDDIAKELNVIDAAKRFPQAAANGHGPIIIKEPVRPRGWRFTVHRDNNDLINEIIAEPIE